MTVLLTQAPAQETARPEDVFGGLIRPAVEGDRAAMRALLTAVAPVVARAARRVLGGRHADVEDVAQQALTAFVKRLPHFRGESSLRHFAERIAVYRALSARRETGVRQRLSSQVGAEPGDDAPSPFAGTAARRRRALLMEALDAVPAPQAEALALHFLFDHTVAEIACMTGVPEETVRSRLRLGKQALRAKIVKDERLAALREGSELE